MRVGTRNPFVLVPRKQMTDSCVSPSALKCKISIANAKSGRSQLISKASWWHFLFPAGKTNLQPFAKKKTNTMCVMLVVVFLFSFFFYFFSTFQGVYWQLYGSDQIKTHNQTLAAISWVPFPPLFAWWGLKVSLFKAPKSRCTLSLFGDFRTADRATHWPQ